VTVRLGRRRRARPGEPATVHLREQENRARDRAVDRRVATLAARAGARARPTPATSPGRADPQVCMGTFAATPATTARSSPSSKTSGTRWAATARTWTRSRGRPSTASRAGA
jgi:hypothetical protein